MFNRSMFALIMAGGEGSRLKKLTKEVPKPLMRIGGSCFLIDFVLSNYISSNSIVGGAIIVQYTLNQIIDYIFDWITTNSINNFKILPPKLTSDRKQIQYEGTAHSVYLNLDIIEEQNASDFLILAADHVYVMDYDEFFKFHVENSADLTISTIQIPLEETYRFGVFEIDDDNNILSFEEKPKHPKSDVISMGIYIFKKEILIDILNETQENYENLDFGKHVIPHMIENDYNIKIYQFKGLWKDIGVIEDYYKFNMDLLNNEELDQYFAFKDFGFNKKLPIAMNRINKNAVVKNCLMSNGIYISGQVINSVISKNVIIDENTVIENSIILDGAIIKNSVLKNVIITEGSEIIDVKHTSDDIELI